MYAKIFLKIFDSSIAEDWEARIVFQDMLILASRDGVVDMTHESISRRTNVPIEIVKESITKLEAPDPKSNTPEDDGRRIERIAGHKDWGWKILNYGRYRDIKNSEEMRASNRERQKRWRDSQNKDKPKPEPVDLNSDAVKIFTHLNELTGSKFEPVGNALKMLEQRMSQSGVTFDGIIKMIDRQVKLWKDDSKMSEYLRPITLFNATKFNEYYAAREQPVRQLQTGKPNPRNIGVAKAGPSYGDAARTKLERQGLVSAPVGSANNGNSGVGETPV